MDKRVYEIIKNHYYKINGENVIYWIDNKKMTENIEKIAQDIYDDYWMPYACFNQRSLEELKQRIINQQWNDKALPYKEFSSNKDIVWGYKYTKSRNDMSLGNRTPYIKHERKTIVEDIADGYGLHFFLNPRLLFEYMTYGDLLVKIKIDKDIYESMFVKKIELNHGNEYSCRKYYVQDIYDLKKKETLEFILKNVNKKDIFFLSNIIRHLEKIGTSRKIIEQFKLKINDKINEK